MQLGEEMAKMVNLTKFVGTIVQFKDGTIYRFTKDLGFEQLDRSSISPDELIHNSYLVKIRRQES